MNYTMILKLILPVINEDTLKKMELTSIQKKARGYI